MPKPRRMTVGPLIAAMYFLVAGGPFGLEDIVARSGYAGAILILIVTPVIWSVPAALMVAELASAIPEQGGYYIWVTRGMGRFWGFQEAWLSLVGGAFDIAIYPTLFVSYLGHLAPAVTAGPRGTILAAALIVAAAAWNLRGAKSVADSSVVLAILMLAPFALLSVYALFPHHAAGSQSVPLHRADLLGGILVAMWNYMGWDYASTVADEVAEPRRTYPRALAGAVALVVLTYVIPVAAVAMAGLNPNRWATGGWADVARAVISNPALGTAVAFAITCGGMLGAWGTLNSQTMQYSRLPAVLADDGFLPHGFSKRLSGSGAPWVALAALAGIWICCLQFSFIKLLLLDVLLTGLSLILEFVALVGLRVREPNLPRPYRVPGGLPGAIAVGLLPLALLILAAARNEVEQVGPLNSLEFGAILMIAGVPAYYLAARLRRR